MPRTPRALGGAAGPKALPRATLRDCITRCAVRLHHIAALADLDVADDELERAAEHLVRGLAELQPRLELLEEPASRVKP
jgi:hypothetical protein